MANYVIVRQNIRRDKVDLKTLQEIDPLKPQAEVDLSMDEGLSPMSPPENYEAALPEQFKKDEFHPFLKEMMKDHEMLTDQLSKFDDAIESTRKEGNLSKENHKIIEDFFNFFDDVFTPHNRQEEQRLFPVLRTKLIENGEHSKGPTPITGVDVLEAEHTEAIQLSGMILNCFSLYPQILEKNSKQLILTHMLVLGKKLIELMELHIFREDKIIFCLAQNLLSKEELDKMI